MLDCWMRTQPEFGQLLTQLLVGSLCQMYFGDDNECGVDSDADEMYPVRVKANIFRQTSLLS